VTSSPDAIPAADQRQLLCTHAIYGLHALSVTAGVVTTLLGHRTLLFGLPSLVGAVLNVVQRGQSQGSWLASHSRWLWHTFWWMVAGVVAVTVAFGPILSVLTRLPLLEIGYLAVAGWAGWRLARGWRALRAGQSLREETA